MTPLRAAQVVVLADPSPSTGWAVLLPAARAAAALPVDEPFALLVLLDPDPDPAQDPPVEIWDTFLRDGLFFFAAWGDGCERVHDDVDLMVHLDDPAEDPGYAVTIWCTDTLEEALWEFTSLAGPMPGGRDGRLRLVLLDDHVDPVPVLAWFDHHQLSVTRLPDGTP